MPNRDNLLIRLILALCLLVSITIICIERRTFEIKIHQLEKQISYLQSDSFPK